MKSIYLENGYLNTKEFFECKEPFIFCVGGRGIGKTYGVLKELLDIKKHFIFMRLQKSECELCASESGNPFNKLNNDFGTNIAFAKETVYTWSITDNGEKTGSILTSLVNFSKTRGIDYSDVDYIIIDEFIPEKIQKRINGIGESVLNAYETVNRNRELQGNPPVKMIFLANSMNMNNEILMKFGLIDVILRMGKEDRELYVSPERGMRVYYPQHSPISEAKKNTVLYHINNAYNDMALSNTFREFYDGNIKPMSLINSIPVFVYDNMYFYRMRDTGLTYVSTSKRGDFKKKYNDTDYETRKMRIDNNFLIQKYFNKRIIFEQGELELRFCTIFKIVT